MAFASSSNVARRLLLLVVLLCSPGAVYTQQQQQQDSAAVAVVEERNLQGSTRSISGFVYITLRYATITMAEEIQADYDAACAEFFGGPLALLNPPIMNIQAETVEQEIVFVASEAGQSEEGEEETPVEAASVHGGQRALLRGSASAPAFLDADRELQGDVLPALLTLVRVEGEIAQDAETDDLNSLLLFLMVANEQSFINDLQALPGNAGVFFQTVVDVEAFDPNNFTPFPTLAPTEGPTDEPGDSDLAAVGLIFAAIGGFLILGGLLSSGYYFSRKNRPAESTARSAPQVPATPATSSSAAAVAPVSTGPTPVGKPIRDDEVDVEDEPLPKGLIPVAEEKSVVDTSTLPAAIDGGSSSLVGSKSVASGGNVSYTYSLDANSMDQASAQGAISTLGGDQSTDYEGRPNMAVSREVNAPPGKLGIVIDTTLEGVRN